MDRYGCKGYGISLLSMGKSGDTEYSGRRGGEVVVQVRRKVNGLGSSSRADSQP